jgi:hypothetical protein
MTNEMKEILHRLEIFLADRQKSSPEPARAPESNGGEIEAARLCLIAEFFSALPYSEILKPCLQAKRSEIQTICKSKNLDFAIVEKLAESKMLENASDFYRKCNSEQSSVDAPFPAHVPNVKGATELSPANAPKSLNPKLTGKHLLTIVAIGIVILIGWGGYSQHRKAVRQEQARKEQARQDALAYFNEEETFQLSAVNGVNTSFKDIEKSFRDYCSKNNQSVSVKSIGMAFTSQALTHRVDNRITGEEVGQAVANGEVITRKDAQDINRYNSYVGGPRTVSDGGDLSFGVNVTITHRVRKSSDSTAPLSVEWLCPDPSATSKLPMHPGDDLPTLAITKYGIQLTYTNAIYDGNFSLFEAKGLLGTNTFDVKLLSWADYLNLPSDPFIQYQHITAFLLFDSPIEYLQWNGEDIFSLHHILWHQYDEVKDKVNWSDPVWNQPGIKTLATWARDIKSSH